MGHLCDAGAAAPPAPAAAPPRWPPARTAGCPSAPGPPQPVSRPAARACRWKGRHHRPCINLIGQMRGRLTLPPSGPPERATCTSAGRAVPSAPIHCDRKQIQGGGSCGWGPNVRPLSGRLLSAVWAHQGCNRSRCRSMRSGDGHERMFPPPIFIHSLLGVGTSPRWYQQRELRRGFLFVASQQGGHAEEVAEGKGGYQLLGLCQQHVVVGPVVPHHRAVQEAVAEERRHRHDLRIREGA